MQSEQITGDLRVADVLRRWPGTYQVFCRFGCPDMRGGFLDSWPASAARRGAFSLQE